MSEYERTPPHDAYAEQCVLGAMLLSREVASDIATILATADFYRPAHAVVFAAVLAVEHGGTPADAATVAAYLADHGDLDRIGGAAYLHTLIAAVPTAANGPHYARIVASRAMLRRLIETGTRIVQIGYGAALGDEADVAAAVDAAQAQIHAATTGTDSGDAGSLWGELTPVVFEGIDAHAAEGLAGISTGFLDLDRLTGGWRAGQLIIVAARPGMGKSTLVTDTARTAAFRHKLGVVLFSLEMPRQELAERITSAETRVPLHVIRSGQTDDRDNTRILDFYAATSEARLRIWDDAHALTLSTIAARSRRMAQREGLDLIVVDYLQLIPTTGGSTRTREREVAELSRGLKLLAKELGVPVIACAQLNRGPEQRHDKRPALSDLRESGSIENDADVVIFLHRDDYYDKDAPSQGSADVIVAKHRNGPLDTVTVASQLYVSRFADMAIPPSPTSAEALAARTGAT